MQGRRSCDNNPFLGYPSKFSQHKFPTKAEIVSHAAEVRRQKVSDGSWKPNVTRAEVAKNVTEDLREIWMKVPIPLLDFWVSYKKVKKILEEGDKLLKIPIERRTSIFLGMN